MLEMKHTQIQTHTHTYMHVCTCAYVCTHMRTHTHTPRDTALQKKSTEITYQRGNNQSFLIHSLLYTFSQAQTPLIIPPSSPVSELSANISVCIRSSLEIFISMPGSVKGGKDQMVSCFRKKMQELLFIVKLKFFFCSFCLGATPNGAQVFLLSLHTGIIPGRTWHHMGCW